VDGATAMATSTVVAGNLYAGIPSNLTVASFTDSDTSLPASSFTATINWGDGTQSSGTVVGSNGTFQVQGTHTYAQDSLDQSGGVYTVTVTVSDSSGDTLTSSSAVTVLRPPMVIESGGVETPANSLVLSNVQVAAFTVPDTTDGASEFSATIEWGDNSSSSGSIVEVSPGLFEVFGSHTYAMEDDYTITVYVDQGWSAMLAAQAAAPKAEAGSDNIWKPTKKNNQASNTANWTQGVVPNNSEAIFDNKVSDLGIEWNQNVTATTIILRNGYTESQKLDAGVTVTATKGIIMDATSQLNVDFQDTKSTLEVDGGTSTLTNFDFSGKSGTFLIKTATVNIANGAYKERTRSTIKVTGTIIDNNPFEKSVPGTLNIGNQATLEIGGANSELIAGSGGIITLNGPQPLGQGVINQYMIDAFGTNNMILVSGGAFNYKGALSRYDTINIPVYISSGAATIKLGTLVVRGKLAQQGDVSWYMSGGVTELWDRTKLDPVNGYTQRAGTLATIDSEKSTLDSTSGNINVNGGKIDIDVTWLQLGIVSLIPVLGDAPTYGALILDAKQFNMSGMLVVSVDANSNKSDVLEASNIGPANILAGSVLDVTPVGSFPAKGNFTWTIITSTNKDTTFVKFPKDNLGPLGIGTTLVNNASPKKYNLTWSK
jgi:hypothetical protein